MSISTYMSPDMILSSGAESSIFWTMVIIQIWQLTWKGVSLWKAARNKHTGWFIALLLIHLAALIDIIYIFYFSEPKRKLTLKRIIKKPEHKDKKEKSEKT